MSEIRTAILKAADWIESHPQDFEFMSCEIPHECGSPGCALGWIAAFGGHSASAHTEEFGGIIEEVATDFMRLKSQGTFYNRMDEFCLDVADWRSNAFVCARTLRAYADKYHPEASKPSGADICRLIISKPYKELEASNG